MMLIRELCLLLLVFVIPSQSLLCYECACDQTNMDDCYCDQKTTEFIDYDYCVIFVQRFSDTTYIQLSRVPRNSTWIYIEDTYYILTQESIRYNRTQNEWYVKTNAVIFGCDWDLCNSPDLIHILPDSFQLTIPRTWLDQNIYGTGSVSQCHHCPVETCGDSANPIDFSKCPLTSCNTTSCLAYDLWNDLNTGDQCYQSQCAPEYLDGQIGELYGGKYRIDMEAIVYLARDRSQYDIWELDVYCAAYNCTRPTIFQEIIQQLRLNITDLSLFPTVRPTTTQPPPTTTTPITNLLTCYSCECYDTTICPCASTVNTSLDYTYCLIVRENFGQDVYIYSHYLDYDATYMYISELPYVLVDETIDYNERNGRWFTTTNYVIYGCNWNLCNKPELVPLLPTSFQMRLPEAWLNSSVLGSGLPVRDCHECPDEPECGTIEFLSGDTCPIRPCNTTCLVLDLYEDIANDYICYQSFCLPPDTEDYQLDKHRVEIEGIVYASQPTVVQIWEIDIYCRADNCSRPEIFKELHEKLTVQSVTLDAIFNETHDPLIPQRRCYDCFCYDQPTCTCDRTTIMKANSTYCLIMREEYGQDVWVNMGHISDDSTRVHIRDFPYLLIEESILYDEIVGRWNTQTNFVVYGCNWDYCNHPRLIQYLPNTLQMRLPESWLNSSVLGTGQPVRDCHECPDAPQCGPNDFLDAGRCPIRSCNTTCLVFDTFDDPADDLQCYQSFCAPPDTEDYEIDTHRVEIEGILYLDKQPREVELWEVDIYCRADDCSRPEIFKELKDKLITQLDGLSAFEVAIQTTTQNPMTPGETTTTQNPATPGETTTSNASIFASIKLFNMLLLSIMLFYLY